LSCIGKYATRIFLSCLAAALVLISASCNRSDGPDPETRELSENEWYLIEAYANVTHARSLYPHNPEFAESLFVVLDSTIDSVRIANTIRDLNSDPERWEMVFEQLERTMRESASKVESGGIRSEKPGGRP
jgi:hypothetical protein